MEASEPKVEITELVSIAFHPFFVFNDLHAVRKHEGEADEHERAARGIAHAVRQGHDLARLGKVHIEFGTEDDLSNIDTDKKGN